MTRLRDGTALVLVLLGLGIVWEVLDDRAADAEYVKIHRCHRPRPIRYLAGHELPRWWPLDWPEASKIETVSTPRPPLTGYRGEVLHSPED